MSAQPAVRFAVIGVNHGHIYGQVNAMLGAGAEFVSFFAPEPELVEQFSKAYPDILLARSPEEILDDDSIQLVVNAGIPSDRAPLGIEVMKRGKDYMVDKPGFTTLDQLEEARRIQAETGRIYSVCYSERLLQRSTVKAGDLVRQGAIGRVVQTVGLGPHHTRPHTRPDWFFKRERYGGIVCDIGSHQADQFLYFTGSTEAEVVAAQVGNYRYPQYPELEDFGEILLRGNGGHGYIRIDWYTPEGLGVWGDGRLTVLGTEGYIELRKYVDIKGREGGDHLFLVDQKGIQYINCSDVELPYGKQLAYDIVHRTETAMTQAHCFLASELALKAQAQAARFGNLQDS